MLSQSSTVPQFAEVQRVVFEKIGAKEFEIHCQELDIFDDVMLWSDNPRLIPMLNVNTFPPEPEIELLLSRTNGYDVLHKNIREVGQLDAIYVWRPNPDSEKYLVLEGATRVAILRDLARKSNGQPNELRYRRVKVKILPIHFTESDLKILLAKIHVRGSGVRSWGRYVEAKFVYDAVTDIQGKRAVLSVKELADSMGKSVSWVGRLKDAYAFALQYQDHFDNTDEACQQASWYFSTLEEISKSTGFGPKVRADDAEGEKLRTEVFGMVQNEVFKEYRDARFMADFAADQDRWAQLLTGEKHIAHKLANELKVGNTGIKGKILGLYSQLEKTLDRSPELLGEEELAELQECARLLESKVLGGGAFKYKLGTFREALRKVSLMDLAEEIEGLKQLHNQIGELTSFVAKGGF